MKTYDNNELIKKLGISSSNRNPLYDVMFAYQNEAIPVIVFGDKEVESVSFLFQLFLPQEDRPH